MKHHIIKYLPLVMLLGSCSGNNAGGREETRNVFLTEPVAADAPAVHTYPATVEESRSIAVGFKTAGQIERLYAKEGDRVHAGQLLAVLDTVDYALGVAQLEEQVAMNRAEQVRRGQLHASKNMSDNDYEKSVSGLRQMELQLKLQRNKLDYCRLYSPASGVITKRNFESSEMVDAGTPVYELMDAGRLEVTVDLPVGAYADRSRFTGFRGRSALNPTEPIELEMMSLTPRADNNQLFRLKLAIKEPGAASRITPGMNLSVDITMDSPQQGSARMARIPLSAIFDHEGQTYVWAFNPSDSTISRTAVATAGSAGADGTILVSGAPDGAIVRAGVHHLTDGAKVSPIDENSATNPGNVL